MAGKKSTKVDASKTDATSQSSLSAKELDSFKELLLNKRRELLQNVNNIEEGALKKNRQDASGDLSMMPVHMADLGTDNYEQEFALDLIDTERKLLLEIAELYREVDKRGNDPRRKRRSTPGKGGSRVNNSGDKG